MTIEQINTSKVPGPYQKPIFGNAGQLKDKDFLQFLQEMWWAYGDVVEIKLGPITQYLVAGHEEVHHIFVKNQKNYVKGMGYDGLRLLMGNGLVTSNGDTWRQQRRLMQPPFTPRAINEFTAMMVDVTQRLIDSWEDGQTLNMEYEMRTLTMSIISRAMFGVDIGDGMDELGDALQEVFAFIPDRAMSVLQFPLEWPLPKHQQHHRNMEIINNFITERINYGRQNPQEETLLNRLLQARDEETGEGMDEQQLRDEVITLFFAGFETTALTLTWGWYLLAKNPEVRQALQVEVDEVLKDKQATVDDLFKLTYSRMVTDEVLRLYPPTAVVSRHNLEDDIVGGYHFPAGTAFIPSPYMVHRDPALWPNPEKFDPQRFTPENIAERPKSAYVPFANGQRICLGNNFALLEMVLAYAMISRTYELTLVDETPVEPILRSTTRPSREVVMIAKKR